MTINETIAKYKEITNINAICPAYCNISCEKCVHESRQLAEWLEELKTYKEIGTIEECKNSVLDIIRAYNKAIDDYNKEINEYLRKFTVHYVSDNDFDYIAEQLKAGKKNE